MKEVIVFSHQTLFDLAIEYYGSIAAVFDLAVANGLAVSADISSGTTVVLPNATAANGEVVSYFAGKGQHIATGGFSSEDSSLQQPSGIGYWAVGVDFLIQ